jgi:hypothetical protein
VSLLDGYSDEEEGGEAGFAVESADAAFEGPGSLEVFADDSAAPALDFAGAAAPGSEGLSSDDPELPFEA